ncbi:cutinase family protein [Mycobacterium sp. Y57]|uniref:cutinase family protein n=1 Tax=Mycolicibacterium xanthum TaxID=2796469 RepID=UPI001C862F76|nr:cutinase family protein [Mycolicibacterium xanthum]MBX7431854.1 cutinase family protein [Mycolicibacterium xanthum]
METRTFAQSVRVLCAAGAAAWALPVALLTSATSAAAPCPDVEVVFARGTTEPPGVGGVGQAFVDALRGQVGGRSVGVYAVNYPASHDFARSTPAGADDARSHIEATAANCPNTRMVLGGFSQGAGVIDLASNGLPVPVTDRVAAVADFGGPRTAFSDSLSVGPLPVLNPVLAGRAIDMCVPNDPICYEGGWDMSAHNAYVATGMVQQAAQFAARRLR